MSRRKSIRKKHLGVPRFDKINYIHWKEKNLAGVWILFTLDVGRIIHNTMNKLVAATATKSLQLCLTLCNPIDGSPPGSPVPGILQARTLEWVAVSFSNAWKWKVKVKSLSRVRPFETPWTAAYHAPPSMAFSRQEYWSGLVISRFENS